MKIPEHMQPAIDAWVNQGLPSPSELGHFLYAVLTNNFTEAVIFADDENRDAIVSWAFYMHNEVPALAHGTPERLREWHRRGGLEGIRRGNAA